MTADKLSGKLLKFKASLCRPGLSPGLAAWSPRQALQKRLPVPGMRPAREDHPVRS